MKLRILIAMVSLTGTLLAQRTDQSISNAQAPADQPPLPVDGPTTTVGEVKTSEEQKKADAKKKAEEDEIVEMSVFTVTGSDDEGYLGMNTTSGSRLKTRLKDTPASISPFTEEFLSDIGATAIQDMLEYAGNVEMDFEDSTNGFNNANSRGAVGQSNFRVRGISAGISSNAFESGVPQDINSIERAEMSSGPNSILFGMGNQGGTLNTTFKRAKLNRNTLTIRNVTKAWNNRDNLGDAFHNQIFNIDYNLVMIPRRVAIRLLGTYANSGSWKYRQDNDEKRISPTITFRPYKNTNIVLRYEVGKTSDSPGRVWAATDRVGTWIAAGRPLYANFGGAVATDPLVGKITGDANTLVYVDNSGLLFNERQSLQTLNNIYGIQTPLYYNQGGKPSAQALEAFAYNTIGPGAIRSRKFESWTATVEQRVGIFSFDLSYNHSKATTYAYASDGDDAALRADPNVYLSPPSWAGTDISNLMTNPNAGRLYLQANWQQEDLTETNDALRLMGSTTLRLKKFGRHNIVGMLELSAAERLFQPTREIWVDDNNVAIFNAGSPQDGTNQVVRRHYVEEDNFKTYYDGDGSLSVPGFTLGDRTFHSTFVSKNAGNAHTTRNNISYMLALQSYWFKGRLITTFGYRLDDIKFKRELQSKIVATDEAYLNRTKVLNEMAFNGNFYRKPYNLTTYNAGAVYHMTKRFSVFGNFSSNNGAPYMDARAVLPDGATPPPTQGRTTDYGVMVDVFGNDKFFFKITRFDTQQIQNAVIVPAGTNSPDNDTLGSTNLGTIYRSLRDAGLITEDQFIARPHYNCGMVDVFTKGYEAELTGNFKNWNFRATYSYSERERKNIFNEIFAYYNTNVPIWMDLAKNNPEVVAAIKQQLYYIPNGKSVRAGLDDQLTVQTGGLNSVPHKVTLFGRYNFKKGFLRGFTAGGGFRYNSRRLMPDPRRTGFKSTMTSIPDGNPENLGMDLGAYEDASMIKPAASTWFADAFLTYRRKVFSGKSTMMIQLNVRNLFDNYRIVPGRMLIDGNEPDNPTEDQKLPLVVRRVYVNPPRSYQLTVQFDF